MRDEGGAAFAKSRRRPNAGDYPDAGMSMRQWYAGQVLIGMSYPVALGMIRRTLNLSSPLGVTRWQTP